MRKWLCFLLAALFLPLPVLFSGCAGQKDARVRDEYVIEAVYENGTLSGQMIQSADIDAWTVAYHIGVLHNSSSYNKSTDHMFYYTLKDADANVRVEAIDRFGNKYEQTVFATPDSHPGEFHTDF